MKQIQELPTDIDLGFSGSGGQRQVQLSLGVMKRCLDSPLRGRKGLWGQNLI